VEICVVERAKIDEPVSVAIMCDNYRKTEELKVGVCENYTIDNLNSEV
jgi:hypothetical protein